MPEEIAKNIWGKQVRDSSTEVWHRHEMQLRGQESHYPRLNFQAHPNAKVDTKTPSFLTFSVSGWILWSVTPVVLGFSPPLTDPRAWAKISSLECLANLCIQTLGCMDHQVTQSACIASALSSMSADLPTNSPYLHSQGLLWTQAIQSPQKIMLIPDWKSFPIVPGSTRLEGQTQSSKVPVYWSQSLTQASSLSQWTRESGPT